MIAPGNVLEKHFSFIGLKINLGKARPIISGINGDIYNYVLFFIKDVPLNDEQLGETTDINQQVSYGKGQ